MKIIKRIYGWVHGVMVILIMIPIALSVMSNLNNDMNKTGLVKGRDRGCLAYFLLGFILACALIWVWMVI